MFVIKRVVIFLSMFLLSYTGEDGVESTSFFASWLFFLALILFECIENLYEKKLKGEDLYIWFYRISITFFSALMFLSFFGSLGLIVVKNSVFQPDHNFILVKWLFLLLFDNKLTIDLYILTIALSVTLFLVIELFTKPTLSYYEKHKLKQEQKAKSNRRDVS